MIYLKEYNSFDMRYEIGTFVITDIYPNNIGEITDYYEDSYKIRIEDQIGLYHFKEDSIIKSGTLDELILYLQTQEKTKDFNI